MSTDLSLKEIQKEYHGTLRSYLIGFIASLLLTTASFSIVITRLLSGQCLNFHDCCLSSCTGDIPAALFFALRTRSQTTLGDDCVLFHDSGSVYRRNWDPYGLSMT